MLSGTSLNPYLLSDYHHPQRSGPIDNVAALAYTKAPCNGLSLTHMTYLSLYSWLHGDHNSKLNTLPEQILDQLGIEKSAVGPNSQGLGCLVSTHGDSLQSVSG